MKFSFFLPLFFTGLLRGMAQDYPEFMKTHFIQEDDTLLYRLLWPADYDSLSRYPLLVFLHGSGERGNDNVSQLKYGGAFFTDSLNRKKYPAFILFPQCRQQDYWARVTLLSERSPGMAAKRAYRSDTAAGFSLGMLMQLLDSMRVSSGIDTNRLYIAGLSMGAMGTFELLQRKPGFFAAAAAMCGGGNPEVLKSTGHKTPVWIFHGSSDNVVNVDDSRQVAATLKTNGWPVRYTEYNDIHHGCWNQAFGEPELLSWIFSHRK